MDSGRITKKRAMSERGAMAKRHTDREYESELGRVHSNLLLMTGRVEQMIASSVRALLDGDTALAERTIEDDHKVNRLEVDTDDLCLLILAKRQPVAVDLRFITLAMKMVTDLERIGDLAVNISERVLALKGRPVVAGPLIARMAEIDGNLLRDAIDAFVKRDPEKAQQVWDSDEGVDRLYVEVVQEVQKKMYSDKEFVEPGMHLQAVAKFLERIGDHIMNLAELVIFLVKGKDIRHLGKLDTRPA
jgi:phosphate transport system protein